MKQIRKNIVRIAWALLALFFLLAANGAYSIATTGLAGPSGDEFNPVGTVWIGASGPHGTSTIRYQFNNDRKRNIERFSASALDFLRRFVLADLNH